MIELAHQRLGDSGIDATVRRADVRNLPYSSARFDLVIAAHVLEDLPNPLVALNEIQRVLKTGGWLIVCFTRNSILGLYIQIKWRTHRLTPELAKSWLNAAGLNAHPIREPSSGCFRLSSLACIGGK